MQANGNNCKENKKDKGKYEKVKVALIYGLINLIWVICSYVIKLFSFLKCLLLMLVDFIKSELFFKMNVFMDDKYK